MDKLKFLATFKSEAEELIQKLENGLLELEKNPANIDLIIELNRSAHTLKGAARMMSFTALQDEAHKIEDTFARISRSEYPFTSDIASSVLKQLDQIKTLKDQALEDPFQPAENKAIPIKPSIVDEYIKVPLHRIDELVNLVGETIVIKSKAAYKASGIKHLTNMVKDHYKKLALLSEKTHMPEMHELAMEANQIKTDILNLGDNILSETLHLDPLVNELQAKAREMRMLPASTIFDAFPRLVRDIAEAQKKEIEFVVEGAGTEVDKKILEEINPALMHLIRNAIDHGIKDKGQIKLSAKNESGNILVEVSDNGQGIDLEKIKAAALKKKLINKNDLEKLSEKEILNFIFLPGFSTAEMITDISGRGIGMDIVKTQVEKVRGQIKVESFPGQGTKITLKLPLTIAIIQAMFIGSAGQIFAIPLLSIDENLEIKKADISSIEGNMMFNLREHALPLVRLDFILGLGQQKIQAESKDQAKEAEQEKAQVVIISSIDKKVGLIVDKILREEEIYIKPIGDYLGKIKNIEGAAIVGTGEVIVVLDTSGLIEISALKTSRSAAGIDAAQEEIKKKILVVEDSFTTRELERSMLEARGYIVSTAVDGLDAIDKLSREQPDLIVTDIQMPRMDGFDMCQAVRKNDSLKNIPVVMVTALEKEEDKRRGIEVGANAYITKSSFEQKNLLETIERLIG